MTGQNDALFGRFVKVPNALPPALWYEGSRNVAATEEDLREQGIILHDPLDLGV